MATCNLCGQTIYWVETDRGKAMPVDSERVRYEDLELGDAMINEDGVFVTKGTPHSASKEDWGEGYLSHFSTCPARKHG